MRPDRLRPASGADRNAGGPRDGLINAGLFARTSGYGFDDHRITDEIEYLSAIEESKYVIAQANAMPKSFKDDLVSCRFKNEFTLSKSPDKIEYMDVAPAQFVSVAASLIPFLEHDDANRALMGSNMQRQAVPVLLPEAPRLQNGHREHGSRLIPAPRLWRARGGSSTTRRSVIRRETPTERRRGQALPRHLLA